MPLGESFQESRMPGNPLVRFDEGRVGRTARCPPSLLLYRLCERLFVLTGVDGHRRKPGITQRGAKTQRRAGQACGAIEFHGPLTPAEPGRGLCERCVWLGHHDLAIPEGTTRLSPRIPHRSHAKPVKTQRKPVQISNSLREPNTPRRSEAEPR
jgi:hypothetical protein